MSPRRARKFGLIGTITKDFISSEPDPGTVKAGDRNEALSTGAINERAPGELAGSVPADASASVRASAEAQGKNAKLGGILYQAAALCGLDEDVHLHSNVGLELLHEVKAVTGAWTTLRPSGIRPVPGAGNRVHLYYPLGGERRETLESVVSGLDPEPIRRELPQYDFLIAVINSGFDLELGDWRAIVRSARCPVWLDVHSLVLTKVLNAERRYRALPEWHDWIEGVAYLQANRKEAACLLGRPDGPEGWPSADSGEAIRFSEEAFAAGVRAVFLTLGNEGALVMTPAGRKIIPPPQAGRPVDTTGCGDVFCAVAASALARGEDPVDAAERGVELSSRAASVSGIQATYELARLFAQC